ncbi:MAG: molybdopterin-guanine dinucleotide biosynthesis protein B [Pseudomonadota bacterium]
MRVVGVVGWKNSGKTGLVERLVREVTGRGLRVSTVKHAHHAVDVDQPGTDSHRHRAAGAQEVLLASANRWALMAELRGAPEPALEDLLGRLSAVDLVLVEGFKRAAHTKIEAHRRETGQPLLATSDATIRMVASNDGPTARQAWSGGPILDLDDTAAIADAVLADGFAA